MVEIVQAELAPGTTLCGGKYVIDRKIGAGGFGITYIANHTTLGKKYAIKEFFMSGYNVRNNVTNHVSLHGIEVEDFDRIRQNFINEARTLAQLDNVSVVKVIDIFDENGTSYMVMPFVEGITLQQMVEKNGPMEYDMAVNYMVQICEALTYIHSKSILHRDVTPDNVIVTPEQKIVLIDFGSARRFIDNKTQRQTTIVKPGYAPLEQHSATSRKGAYTDLYSVGAVFYYLLTGERPMDATERVLEKMKAPIELNPRIPNQINAIIMKAMEMDSSKRYQSAAELIEDIFSDDNPENDDKTVQQRSIEVPVQSGVIPDKTKQNPQKAIKKNGEEVPKRKRKVWPWLVSAGMLLVAAAFFWYFGKYKVAGGGPGKVPGIGIYSSGNSEGTEVIKTEEEIQGEISNHINTAHRLFEENQLVKYQPYDPMIGELSKGWLCLLQADSLLRDLTLNEDIEKAKIGINETKEKYLEHISSVYRDEYANLVEMKKGSNAELIHESEVRVGQLQSFLGFEGVKARTGIQEIENNN